MRVSQRSGLLAGVALLACAAAALAVVITRLYAALFGQHAALLGASLPLLGLGLGGILLHAAPGLARPPSLFARLATLSALAAGATVIAVIVLLHFRPIEDFAPRSVLKLAGAYAVAALPFAFGGVAVVAAFRHAARDAGRLFLGLLLGGAAGGLAAVGLLRAGAPRAGLGVAIVVAAAGVVLWLASQDRDGAYASGERSAPGGLVATFALGTTVLLLGDIGAPWAKLPAARWVPLDKVEMQAWTDAAFITVERPRAGLTWIRLDGSGGSQLLDPKIAPPAHPEEMAYALHGDRGPSLILNAGGGRDVLDALQAGQKEIHAVDANPFVVDKIVRGRYAALSGDLYAKPEVRATIGDGRAYARRAEAPFRSIVVSLLDNAPAVTAGALALTESRLYTVEALRDLLARLTPDGTLVVSRWDGEADRLLALGAAAARASGAASPKDHLFACSAARVTSLLIKLQPLAAGEVDLLRKHCRKNKLAEVFAPDEPRTERRRWIVDAVARGAPLDVAPPTDDRPFFSYTVPTGRLIATLRAPGALKEGGSALLAVLALIVVGGAILIAALIGPLLGRPAALAPAPAAAPDRGPRARALAFSMLFGAGFVLLQAALVQRLAALLGHPSAALSVALPVLLLAAGAGAVLTARKPMSAAAPAAAVRAQLLVVLAVAAAAGLGPLLAWGLPLPLGARLGLTLAVLIPPGLLLGGIGPLGVRLIAARAPAMLPWCWGLGALAALVATGAGALLAASVGYSALLLAGGVAFLLASATVPPVAIGEDGGPRSLGRGAGAS